MKIKKLLLCLLLISSNFLNGQSTWEQLPLLNSENIEIIHFSESRILGTIQNPPSLLVSDDMGATWTDVGDLPVQNQRTPLVDIDVDGNYLLLFNETVYKLDNNSFDLTLFIELPESNQVFNTVAGFNNGNVLVRGRQQMRLYNSVGDLIEFLDFSDLSPLTVTKSFLKGSGDEHYFFLSPGNVFLYVVKMNSDLEILEEHPDETNHAQSRFVFDGSRFYSTTSYSDDGITWTDYQNNLSGIITVLNNGNIHLISGCSGQGTSTSQCTQIYVSTDQGASFEIQSSINLGYTMPSAGAVDLRSSTRLGSQAVGAEGVILYHEGRNFYSENGINNWLPIGQEFGLPLAGRVEAASVDNVYVGENFTFDQYTLSSTGDWLDLQANACDNFPKLFSLSNGNILGTPGCISLNNGQNWQSNGLSFINRFFEKDEIAYCLSSTTIRSSSDFGLSWSSTPLVDFVFDGEFMDEDYSSEGFLYLFDYGSSGQSFQKYGLDGEFVSEVQIAGQGINRLRTNYSGPEVYGLNSNFLFFSDDNAETFVFKDLPPVANETFRDIYVDHENDLYIYSKDALWYSEDEGDTWKDITPNSFPDLQTIEDFDVSWDGYAFLATKGAGVLRISKADLEFLTSINAFRETAISVYPNPAQEKINIEVDAQNFEIRLINQFGTLVKTANNATQLSTNGLAAGIYLLEIIDLDAGLKSVERVVLGF